MLLSFSRVADTNKRPLIVETVQIVKDESETNSVEGVNEGRKVTEEEPPKKRKCPRVTFRYDYSYTVIKIIKWNIRCLKYFLEENQ